MIISKTCSYSIRALAYLNRNGHDGYISVKDISSALGLSAAFLSKILFQLAASDIIRSHKGPGGGVALNKPAEDIRLKDIIIAVDGDALFTECLLRIPGCGKETPCVLNERWGNLRSHINSACQHMNLNELSLLKKEHHHFL